jgi:hypothetical protein
MTTEIRLGDTLEAHNCVSGVKRVYGGFRSR